MNNGTTEAAGYSALIDSLRRITNEDNVRTIAEENWPRVLDPVL